MKSIIIITTVLLLGNTFAFKLYPRGLNEDLQDFLDALPKQEIIDLAIDYFLNDKEFQDSLLFFQGPEFAAIWKQVTNDNGFQDLIYYLEDGGLPIVNWLNVLADLLNLPDFPAKPKTGIISITKGGIGGFVDDFLNLLPLEKFKALAQEKLITSPEFKALYDRISSVDFQKIVKFVTDSKELSEAIQILRDRGVPVDNIINE